MITRTAPAAAVKALASVAAVSRISLHFLVPSVAASPDFFDENVYDWEAGLAPLRGNNDRWQPTRGLELNGQFAWRGTVPEPGREPKDLTIQLGFELTASGAIDETFETFIGWAFLAKGSADD